MGIADIAILGSLALIAGLPVIPWLIAKLRGVLPAGVSTPAVRSNQQWVQTLMSLQEELEQHPDQQPAVDLCRQLIWLLVGGAPDK